MAKKERPIKGAPTARDFKGDVNPDWCPGCGDFGVLAALQTAYAETGRGNHTSASPAWSVSMRTPQS